MTLLEGQGWLWLALRLEHPGYFGNVYFDFKCYHDHANLRQRSPSYSPPRSSYRRSPSYEAPRRNSDRCCIASHQNFSIKCIGLDPGTRGAPGLLHLEAGKTMGGKNMRKILACLRLVERRSRRSIAGKDRIQSCQACIFLFQDAQEVKIQVALSAISNPLGG